MRLVKEVRLSLPAFLLLALFPIVMAGENCYLASVNVRQQHTIRQYMGLEQGVDATPQPPKVPKGPEAPKPFTDQRRWLDADAMAECPSFTDWLGFVPNRRQLLDICRARNVESNKKFADASKHFKDQHLGGSIEGV